MCDACVQSKEYNSVDTQYPEPKTTSSSSSHDDIMDSETIHRILSERYQRLFPETYPIALEVLYVQRIIAILLDSSSAAKKLAASNVEAVRRNETECAQLFREVDEMEKKMLEGIFSDGDGEDGDGVQTLVTLGGNGGDESGQGKTDDVAFDDD
eukprot:PhF_6_TR12474/c0_g1_i3/m.19611